MQAGFTASCSGISKLAADLPSVNIDSSNAHALCGTAEAFLRLAHFAFFSDGCACMQMKIHGLPLPLADIACLACGSHMHARCCTGGWREQARRGSQLSACKSAQPSEMRC